MSTEAKLKKFNLFTTEQRWSKIKSRAASKGLTLQEYWDKILDKIIDGIDGGDTGDTGVVARVPSVKVVAIASKVNDELSLEDPMGNCALCKFYKQLTEETYIDSELIRQTEKICSGCKRRAEITGDLR